MLTHDALTAEERSVLAYVETLLEKRGMMSAIAMLRDERTKVEDLRTVIEGFRRVVSMPGPMRQKRKQRTTEENGASSGVAAWDYVDRYIKLKAKALLLQEQGLTVKTVLPDFPRCPLLIIGK